MKKVSVIALAIAIGLVLSGAAYALWGGYGMGYGTSANIETVKKFQKETLNLRDEIMTKYLELENEYKKPSPDSDRIANLRKEIIDLQTKIQAVANKYQGSGCIPMGGMMGQGMMMAACPMGGMMGRGMIGQGMMMGPMMATCPMGW